MYRAPRKRELGHNPPHESEQTVSLDERIPKDMKNKLTLHEAIKPIARSKSIADQSSSMQLIANAQYKVRRSDSLLPGTIEKLMKV